MSHPASLEALPQEDRRFPPDPEFAARANARDDSLYENAAADHLAFWAEQAERLDWYRRWDRVLEWDPPFAKWFVGGRLNAGVQGLRHWSQICSATVKAAPRSPSASAAP